MTIPENEITRNIHIRLPAPNQKKKKKGRDAKPAEPAKREAVVKECRGTGRAAYDKRGRGGLLRMSRVIHRVGGEKIKATSAYEGFWGLEYAV